MITLIFGDSGAGKTTLLENLLKIEPKFKRIVGHTTRPMRPGEKNKTDYYFVSKEELLAMDKKGEFDYTFPKDGNLYGTSKKELVSAPYMMMTFEMKQAATLHEKFIRTRYSDHLLKNPTRTSECSNYSSRG